MNDYKEYKAITKADAYQGAIASVRVAKSLRQGPLKDCSLDQLKAIHAQIFQDFPNAWFNPTAASFFDELPESFLTFEPGTFREPTDHYNPWMKIRHYEHADIYTFYSCANESDAKKINDYLQSINMVELAAQPFSEKISDIAKTYHKLDFFHPFQDGNSRANRVFISRLAEAAGVQLAWSKVDILDLYAARDLNLLAEAGEYYKGNDEVEMLIEAGLRVLKERHSLTLDQLLVSSGAVKEISDLQQEYGQEQNNEIVAEFYGSGF